ncbi:MAG: sensor histidine kinase [Actinobacteria bacterium]|nr:sensor histidine kinase [Actinomycetota bacterium]
MFASLERVAATSADARATSFRSIGRYFAVRRGSARASARRDRRDEGALDVERPAQGRVRLAAVERDGKIELHVRDEGRGFPPEFLPRAFDRFSRADDARSGDGTGLGLTIATAIARAHGGSAHAESPASGGADVWLSLPKR